jgi:integrase
LFYFNFVKRKANVMKAKVRKESAGLNHGGHFIAVTDSRNRKIRGLWQRNGRYYAQLRIPGEKSPRRVALMKNDGEDSVPVETYSEAIAARDEILHSRRHGKPMKPRGRKPLLADAAAEYIRHHRSLAQKDEERRTEKNRVDGDHHDAVENQDDAPKKLSTVRKEELILALWKSHIGNIPIDRIAKAHVTAYLGKVLESGKKKRTRNIHLSILRNLLNHFADRGVISHDLPTAGVKLLKHKTPKRAFLSPAQLDSLVAAALHTKGDQGKLLYRNGQSLADLIRLLAFSGAREMEALRLKWADVDLKNGFLHIGRDGKTKNRESRTVDFNPDLEAHLLDMKTRRAPDSPWVFPSPKRGDSENHECWHNPHKIWYSVREKAGLEHAHLHDLRHYFASQCVMAGIDYMTIAGWLGHSDGGILVGQVYGHLADEHKKRQAKKLTLSGPRITPEQKPETGSDPAGTRAESLGTGLAPAVQP